MVTFKFLFFQKIYENVQNFRHEPSVLRTSLIFYVLCRVTVSWSGKRAKDLEIRQVADRLYNMAIHLTTPVSLTNDEKSWPGKTHTVIKKKLNFLMSCTV